MAEVHFINLPDLVISRLLDYLDFESIKTLRQVCTTTNGWIEDEWGFWDGKRTRFIYMELSLFTEANYSRIANILNNCQDEGRSLSFHKIGSLFHCSFQSRLDASKIVANFSKFINTQFANMSDQATTPPNDLLPPTEPIMTVKQCPESRTCYVAECAFHFNPELNPGPLLNEKYTDMDKSIRNDSLLRKIGLVHIYQFDLILDMDKTLASTGRRVLRQVVVRLECRNVVNPEEWHYKNCSRRVCATCLHHRWWEFVNVYCSCCATEGWGRCIPKAFIQDLGPGQLLVGRQAQCLGDIQLRFSERKRNLEKSLVVEVVRAGALQVKIDSKITPAPYVKLYLLKGKKCLARAKTHAAPQTGNPLYQRELVFKEKYRRCILQVKVWGVYGRRKIS